MYCKNCGKELLDNSAFCSNCGSPQSTIDRVDNNTVIQEETKLWWILSIVFAFLINWLGIVFGIIGLVTYKNQENRKLSLVGLVISVVIFIISMIVYIFIFRHFMDQLIPKIEELIEKYGVSVS